MPTRITTYEQAFALIEVPFDEKAKSIIKELESNGHAEKSICFAIWKDEYRLLRKNRSKGFWNIFMTTIKKWSWAKDDPRWIAYNAKKKELNRVAKKYNKLKPEIKERAYNKPYSEHVLGFIYFVQGENGGPIKIGYTKDIARRLKALQTGYPDILKVLLAFPGNEDLEQTIHRQLDCFRLNGEWFSPDPILIEYMNELESANKKLKKRKKTNPTWNDYCN